MPFQVCDIFKAKLCTTLHISSIVFFISSFGAHYRIATSVVRTIAPLPPSANQPGTKHNVCFVPG